MSVPVRGKRQTSDSLEDFARRIEERLSKGANQPFAMERLMCRLMTGKDRKVAAMIASKWTEWRFGKAKETVQFTGTVTHEHFDASKLTDEQLAQVENIVESAHVGTDQG